MDSLPICPTTTDTRTKTKTFQSSVNSVFFLFENITHSGIIKLQRLFPDNHVYIAILFRVHILVHLIFSPLKWHPSDVIYIFLWGEITLMDNYSHLLF